MTDKNKRKLNLLIFSVVFILSNFITIGAGYYRKSVSTESGKFKVDLGLQKENEIPAPIIFDIQNEGVPKKLIQPGRISISTGHGGGITNKSSHPVWLNVKTAGLIGNTTILSSNPSFDKQSFSFKKPLEPGKSVNLTINLDIPRRYLSKGYLISEGSILLIDSNTGKNLTVIPIRVVNSSVS